MALTPRRSIIVSKDVAVISTMKKSKTKIITRPEGRKSNAKKLRLIKTTRKHCSFEGCTNKATSGGVCKTHGAKKYIYICTFDKCTITHGAPATPRQQCNQEGCTNIAIKGGVCITHGAETKRCSFDGCTNQPKKGGVCITHGAEKKGCSFKSCMNKAYKGGVCTIHGANMTRKRCNYEGCTKYPQKGGVCKTHGAIVIKKRCTFVGGCTNQAIKGGVCVTHGAKMKGCSIEGCTYQAQKGGVCVTHGAKVKRCNFEGCNNHIVKGGVCWAHGAKGVVRRCSFEGCTNYVQKGGVCVTHGAKIKRCSHEGCNKCAIKGGVCITHGAEVKRCSFEGCNKYVVKGGVCVTHGAKVKRCSHMGCIKQAQKGGVCCRHRSNISINSNNNSALRPKADGIKEAIKVFQSKNNPTGADWTLLVEALAPSAVDDVEAVGYMIRKEFSSGWFRGIVGLIRENAAGGRTRRVFYEDGDSEDLSLLQLKSLPSEANKTIVKQRRAASGVQATSDREEFVTCNAANNNNNNNNLMLQSNADLINAIPPHQLMNYEDEEELNSWIWRSNARMASHLASYNVTGPVVSAPSVS